MPKHKTPKENEAKEKQNKDLEKREHIALACLAGYLAAGANKNITVIVRDSIIAADEFIKQINGG